MRIRTNAKLPCGRTAGTNVIQNAMDSTQGPRGSRVCIRTNVKLPCGHTASNNVIQNMMGVGRGVMG